MKKVIDADGKLIEVIIPAEEWAEMEAKMAGTYGLVHKGNGSKRSFAGILTPEQADDLRRHVAQTKTEWDRDIYPTRTSA